MEKCTLPTILCDVGSTGIVDWKGQNLLTRVCEIACIYKILSECFVRPHTLTDGGGGWGSTRGIDWNLVIDEPNISTTVMVVARVSPLTCL